MGTPTSGPRSWPAAWAARILGALPPRWLLVIADACAPVWRTLDPRGRRIAADNLHAVYGDPLDAGTRRRLTRAAYRERARATLVRLARLSAPTRIRRTLATVRAIVVSGNLGLAPLRSVTYLDVAADGDSYVPFLGLPAPTSLAPARAAVEQHLPLVPMLCLPAGPRRYRIWVGPDLTVCLPEGTSRQRTLALAARANHVLASIVRAAPEAWHWTCPRFERRPTLDLGPYPPYSRYDPTAGVS